MPTTTKSRLTGPVLLVALDGTPIGCWDNMKLDISAKSSEATCASSTIDQFVLTTRTAKGTIDTYMGANQVPIISVGDQFTVLSIKEGTNDVSAILADVNALDSDFAGTKARVTAVSESYGKDAAKCTISFTFGFVD